MKSKMIIALAISCLILFVGGIIPALIVLGILCALLVMAKIAPKDDLELALKALEREDYEAALKGLYPLAEQGDATAQFHLAGMYGLGQGVAQDYVCAYMWYNLAVLNGSADAVAVRDELAKVMTDEQIMDARRLSMSLSIGAEQ